MFSMECVLKIIAFGVLVCAFLIYFQLFLREMLLFHDVHLKTSKQKKMSCKEIITPGSLYPLCVLIWQNYFRDAWNVFDFVTVLGSITDILVTEIAVSTVCSICFIYQQSCTLSRHCTFSPPALLLPRDPQCDRVPGCPGSLLPSALLFPQR